MDSIPVGEIVAQRYELLDVIGRGGQGTVYRARDLSRGELVAVKVIQGHLARHPDVVERMAREQQAMLALAGTHAVGFLDLCSSEQGALCLVMELLHGQELETTLVELENRGERLSVAQLVAMLTPIVETLEKAHSVGIVHRDLKPGNIFLLSAEVGGGSRLLDFGFARLSDSKRVTNTGMVMGSPSYIAPEMWKGQGKSADHRVDVYAFGVIVYRALAGELPFPNHSMQETLMLVTQAKRPSLHQRRPDLPPRVDAWVETALAIDREQRFQSVRACWNELLWALDLAPFSEQLEAEMVSLSQEASKIREWLEEPVTDRSGSVNNVWTTVSTALKRLIGRSTPSPPLRSGKGLPTPVLPPPKRITGTPPPLPKRTEVATEVTAKVVGSAEKTEKTAPVRLGPPPRKIRPALGSDRPAEAAPSVALDRPTEAAPPVALDRPAPKTKAVAGKGQAKPAPPPKFGKPKWKSRRHRKSNR